MLLLRSRAQRQIKSRQAKERLQGIAWLDHHGTTEDAPLLIEALRDRLSYVGAAAARAIIRVATPEILGQLIEHFLWASKEGTARDPGCSVRQELAVALGNLQDSRAEAALRIGLATTQVEMVGYGPMDTAVGLRANCALALSQLHARGVALDLALLLFDAWPRSEVETDTMVARRAAAQALGALGDPGAAIPLALLLRSDPETALELLVDCMDALATVDPDRAAPIIVDYLNHPKAFLVAGAAAALGKTRREEALPPLLETLERVQGDLVNAVMISIAALRCPAARQALIDRLQSARPGLRQGAAAALASFPDQEVQQALLKIARSDPQPTVRRAARESLALTAHQTLSDDPEGKY